MYFCFADGRSNSELEVLRVNATDLDSGENSVLSYSFLKPVRGFSIGEKSGIIKVNQSNLPSNLAQDIQLAVVAKDNGKPPLQSVASVRVKVNNGNGILPNFAMKEYK